jgi:histidinol-phosphatase
MKARRFSRDRDRPERCRTCCCTRAHPRRCSPITAVVGEEDGVSGDDPEAPTWIIDPIDGTTNFVKGNPVFATLIGYAEALHDSVGVVSAPALGTRWDGIVGEVARQDGVAIRVSSVASLVEAEVSFGGLRDIEEDLPGAARSVLARDREATRFR